MLFHSLIGRGTHVRTHVRMLVVGWSGGDLSDCNKYPTGNPHAPIGALAVSVDTSSYQKPFISGKIATDLARTFILTETITCIVLHFAQPQLFFNKNFDFAVFTTRNYHPFDVAP